jgi:ApaG protein
MDQPLELSGLSVVLDRLEHRHDPQHLPPGQPHAFIFFLTIRNGSDRTVTLLGRKWIVEHPDGTRQVIEGDRIVGQTPTLAPGQAFSYNSYHVTGATAQASGSFHGVDAVGEKVFVRIPSFTMVVPESFSAD